MTKARHDEALRTLEDIFGDRIKPARDSDITGATASVMPVNAGEVQRLAEVARRYSVPLVPLGAGTIADTVESEAGLLVRFDLMRRMLLPEGEEPWVEAEPGAPWLEVEDVLRTRGLGLAVYPTSAPRATVGGWLATNGLGVGSFEFGWLSENVLSADVVLPGGELSTVRGEDLEDTIGPVGKTAIVVSARLRTRVSDSDVPFAIAFKDSKALIGAVTDAIEADLPLWHLAFLNPTMARTRGLGEDYLLFGAYPRERSERAEKGIRRMAEDHAGDPLTTAGVHRVWTERFFPVAPAHPTPDVDRTFASVSQLPEMLAEGQMGEEKALQGTVARSKDVLLLTFEPPGNLLHGNIML